MEITWHDDTCFVVRDKQRSIVINPHKKDGNLKGDVVLSSLSEEPAEVEGAVKVFDWPGEYEVKDIPIIAFQAWKNAKAKEEKSAKNDSTLIFCFQLGDVKFCHLGELGHTLTSDMVTEIGDVDILMLKVGEDANLDSKKAMEIIEAIQPRAVIPMGQDLSAASLKNLGADKIETQNKFVINQASDLPVDQMQYVVLNRA